MKTIFFLLLSGLCSFGQNFAVLQAKDHPKPPAGIPADWPIQVQLIGAATELPPQFPPPWQFMTGAQLAQLKADNEAAKEQWNKAQEATSTKPARDRETEIRNAIADLKLIRDSPGTLTGAQLSNAVRALAKALVALIEELRP